MKKLAVSLGLVISVYIGGNAQTPTSCNKKLIGYVTHWSNNSNIDYSNLTHAFFSFLKPTTTGAIVAYAPKQEAALTTYLDQTKKYSCKRFISLADGGDGTFPTMASNPNARKLFIQNVINFCKTKGFDGIDLDWEGMSNEVQMKNYTLLLKEFRQAISDTKLQLTATVYFGEQKGKWIENEALEHADWIQIMVYDQTGLKTSSPFGNHSSFEHFLEAEKYWTGRGFAREKIVMGIPFYGYRFTSEKGGRGKAVKYSQIVATFPNLSPSDNQTPGNDGCFFNGPDLVYKKTKYALENKFAGIMIWEVSQDSKTEKSLLKSIKDAFIEFCTNQNQ